MATPAEILSEAECVVCAGNASMFEVFAIQILKNITSMTQAEIEAESPCFLCYGLSQSQAAILVLLNNLAEGGGVGGTQEVYTGAFVDPNGNVTPTDTTKPALYFPSGGGTLWQFVPASQTWV